jgi:DNA-binding MarR family transcriptional regulator
MNNSLFELTYQELKLLVTQLHLNEDVITNPHERFLIYEAYRRHKQNSQPYSMKWVEQTLKMSFPKIYSMVQRLVTNGYLKRVRSEKDKRIVYLTATNKLTKGVELYEDMKLNELHALGFTNKYAPNKPTLSDFNSDSADQLKEDFLDP